MNTDTVVQTTVETQPQTAVVPITDPVPLVHEVVAAIQADAVHATLAYLDGLIVAFGGE